MYTNGIRKIFDTPFPLSRDKLLSLAFESGLDLATFNGEIWVRISHNNEWIKTSLLLTDFEVKYN